MSNYQEFGNERFSLGELAQRAREALEGSPFLRAAEVTGYNSAGTGLARAHEKGFALMMRKAERRDQKSLIAALYVKEVVAYHEAMNP